MPATLDGARTAVGVVFALNGLVFATLVSRVPDLRAGLGLDNTGLGLLLLALAVGSLVALPVSGALVDRWGAACVVRAGAAASVVGLGTAAIGAAGPGSVVLTAAGLLVQGLGIGLWDVAMNVEGAEVERRLGRTVMPRFHAGFSLGTIAGGLLGVVAVGAGLPLALHLPLVALVGGVATWWAVPRFLPVDGPAGPTAPSGSAWLEPRTLVIGLMVLGFAVAEGSANDWLSLALIDGYRVPHWVGVAGFSVFVTAMTAGRLAGPRLLDRSGRVVTLWAGAGAALLGLLVTVHASVVPHVLEAPVVVLGVLTWGLGASLGFPVGMSAAADDPRRAAARVSVVSTIGYAAFLAGPPLLGRLGDAVGTLPSLQAVAALMVLAALAVPASRPLGSPARSRP